MGPNYVLDKGFKVDSAATAANFKQFYACKWLASDARGATVTSIAATGDYVLGIIQEGLDSAKISTGKATVDVRIMGISRAVASAAIAVGDRVKVTATGTMATTTTATDKVVGLAMSPAAASGDLFDVLLLPGTFGSN